MEFGGVRETSAPLGVGGMTRSRDVEESAERGRIHADRNAETDFVVA